MRPCLIALLAMAFGCEPQSPADPMDPPPPAEPEASEPDPGEPEPGEPEPGEPEPGEPEPAEPEPAEPEPGEPEPGEPEPAEPEPGEPDPQPVGLCNQAVEFDRETATGARVERSGLIDLIDGSAGCQASNRWNGVDLVVAFTALRSGTHRFIARGNGVGHFYRMDGRCVEPAECASLPHHHDMDFFRDRELRLDLQGGEYVVLVADAAHEGFAREALSIEVVTPGIEREPCGSERACMAGLVCGGNAVCTAQADPIIEHARAWWTDGAVHVDIAVEDANHDLAQITVHAEDEIIGRAFRAVWGEQRYRLQERFAVEGRPPAEIVVEVVDQAEARVEQVVVLEPLPIRADGEACDHFRVTDSCAPQSACIERVCVPVAAPSIWGAVAYSADGFLVVETNVGDPDGDFQHLEVRVDGGDWVRLNLEYIEPVRRNFMIASGWVGDLPDGPVEVVAVDREGLRSPSLDAAISAPRETRAGEVCDERQIAVLCPEGLACERGETVNTTRQCIEPERACPAEWNIQALALGEVVDVEFGRDGAPLVWGSCAQQITPARIFTFTAQEAGNHRFTVGHDGDGTGRIWVRRFCNAPRAGELACNTYSNYHGGVSAADAVLEAGEQVTVFVAPHFAGNPQRLMAERTDAPFWE